MKKIFSGILFLSLILVACGEKDRSSRPEHIGSQVMELLEEMGDITRPEFSEYFITLGELHEIGKNKDLVKEERQRKALLKTTKDKFKTRYKFMYKRLKRKGKSLGINWSKVAFKKFDYEIKNIHGSRICAGKLHFTYMNSDYRLNTSSVFDGDDYILVGVGSLKKMKK